VGAFVTDMMGRRRTEGLVGIHTNLLVDGAGCPPQPADSEEARAALEALATFRRAESATSWSRPRGRRQSASPARFTRRPGSLAARSRHRQLLQDLDAFVEENRWASSPGTASSTTSRCTG